MKVVSSKTMALLESKAYQLGYKEIDFMEKAGLGVADIVHSFIEKHNLAKKILMICGKGNNAGDAFVAGFYLIKYGCKVFFIQPESLPYCSELCQKTESVWNSKEGLLLKNFMKHRASVSSSTGYSELVLMVALKNPMPL